MLLCFVVGAQAKTMYLTFDDGPVNGTQNIIDIIEKEHVPATFFMIGSHIKRSTKYRNLYNNAKNHPLITVGNHTYSHARGGYRKFYYSSKQNVVNDLIKTHNILNKDGLTNRIPYTRLAGRNVFRLPNIEKNDIFISKKQSKRENKNYDAVWNAGFYLYGWDYEWEFDYRKKRPKISADQIVKRIERLYKKNKIAKQDKFILLLHDPMFKNKYNGRKILQQLIQKLKSNGWEFDSIANYLTSDDFLYAKYHQNYDGSTATVMANNMQTLPSTPIKAKKIAQAPKIAKYDTKIKIQKKKKKKIVKKPSSVKKQHHVKNTIKAIHNDPKKTMEMQLFEAISRVDVHHVRNLIQSGVNIHAYNRYGQSAIVLATTLKQSNIVQVLIQNGANINHKDQNGNSALMVLQSMTR